MRPLRVLLGLAVGGPLAAFALYASLDHRREIAKAETTAAQMLNVVSEHALKVLETQDLIAKQANLLVRGLRWDEIGASETLHRELKAAVGDLSRYSSVSLVDPAGRLRNGSVVFPYRPEDTRESADFFLAQRERDAGAFVGRAVRSPITGRSVFAMSRRRSGGTAEADAFDGTVVVALQTDRFADFFASVDPGIDTTMLLARADGEVLVRVPARDGANSPLRDDHPLRQGMRAADSGRYVARADGDEATRIFAWKRLAPYLPVYARVGVSRNAAVAGWLRGLVIPGLLALGASGALAALTRLAMRRLAGERAALARLKAEMEGRERAEEQLRQAQKMEAVGQLTGGIAHDFNNMLAIVIGSLDLVRRRLAGGGDERTRRNVENAMEGARRAAALTQRLLAFSRRQALQPEPIDANRLIAGMSDLLRRTIKEDVRIETVLAGGLWRTFADPHQLENAILNLAVNARDAMPDGGRITVETGNAHLDDAYAAAHPGAEVRPGQYVMVAVTDTGTGMSPDVLARAFEPFFTTKEIGRGTGLGLSQVHGFVKQSGGHVKVYSEPGHGTVVKVYLPRHSGGDEPATATGTARPADAEAPRPGSAPARTGERPAATVLVVEDEDGVRRFAVEALRELGYRALEADGAADALRLIDAHPEVALLFTDVVMPEVNGKKLADEALRRRPGLKVLFTTGYTRNAVVHNGVLDPGVELIGKPFTVEQLAAKLRDVLGGTDAAPGRPFHGLETAGG